MIYHFSLERPEITWCIKNVSKSKIFKFVAPNLHTKGNTYNCLYLQ